MKAHREFRYITAKDVYKFAYFRLPRAFFDDPDFIGLSLEAKVLYSFMLSRLDLSRKNGWIDDQGHTYIIFTIEEVKKQLHCAHEKAVKVIHELDSEKGIGLIEKHRQGQGKPVIFYVKAFDEDGVLPESSGLPEGDVQGYLESNVQTSENSKSRRPETGSQGIRKPEVKTSENRNSGLPKTGILDFRNSASSNTENSNTYRSNPSNQITVTGSQMGSDGDGYHRNLETVRENVSYEDLVLSNPGQQQMIDEICEIAAEVLTSRRNEMVISGSNYPFSLVQERMRALRNDHVRYILSSLSQTTTKIRNIKKYLMTAMFNAPVTIDNYYSAEVNHDLMA